MNLVELMKKYPGGKYRRQHWSNGDYYIYNNRNYAWLNREGFEVHVSHIFFEDNWELYEEPLNITKEHMFRKVKLRNGDIAEICGLRPGTTTFPVIVDYGNDVWDECTTSGRLLTGRERPGDIVEILPEDYNEGN